MFDAIERIVFRPEGLNRFKIKTARKYTQTPEERALFLRQQVVAPINRRPQCLMSPVAAGQKSKAVRQPVVNFGRHQRFCPRCGEFDGQRNAFQSSANARDCWNVLPGTSETYRPL